MKLSNSILCSIVSSLILIILFSCRSEAKKSHSEPSQGIIVGAEQMEKYIPLLQNKRVAILINQTSMVGQVSLLDTLRSKKINVVKIFVPEHGFRGTADAGAHIKNEVDAKTGLPLISLYGNNKKPKAEQMQDIDVLVYDLQDVGVRFYTYISTLEYAMDACIENDKELIILDRPNPNRHIIDGPVLDTSLRSFVGMQPVPILYGMTVAEYAKMLVGEKWIKSAEVLKMQVIPCDNYYTIEQGIIKNKNYELPTAPSPNLKTMTAIYWYPSLCFFEGTIVSVGRGTDKPFEQWGHPDYKGKFDYFFTPKSTLGASKPLLENQDCYGELLSNVNPLKALNNQISIDYLLKAYGLSPQKNKFFNSFFEKLAGTKLLRQQIIAGKTAEEIRASWQPDLEKFKQTRSKYLLYQE